MRGALLAALAARRPETGQGETVQQLRLALRGPVQGRLV